MKNIPKILAAKITFASLLFTVLGIPTSAIATGIPVIDGLNVVQTTVSAFENVAQSAKQIEQWQTQLSGLENQLQNTVAPAAYIWDQASSIINKITTATDTINYYKQQTGGIDGYLSKFQNVNYYKNSPCFSNGGCSPTALAAMQQSQTFGSEAQKRVNDAMFKGLDQQQSNLQTDATQLQRLQSQAGSADGQMKAIQAANQLASNQATQLLQIRSLLITQQTAAATRAQAIADQEAMQSAADAQARSGTYSTSPARSW